MGGTQQLLDSIDANLSPFVRTAITAAILGGLLFGLVVEAASATPEQRRARGASYRTNILTFLFNDALVSLISVGSLLLIAQRYSAFGLLSAVQDPVVKFVAAFFVLDLALYLFHRACHSYDLLWCFHKVHHSDTTLNITTSFRLHLLEVLLVTIIKATLIVITGLDAKTVLFAEASITLVVLFQHLDVRFHAEKWLSLLITVPATHRVHHSIVRREQNRNFGAALSIWDRSFGSFAQGVPVQIGLQDIGELGFWQLLRFGVTPARRTAKGRTAKARAFLSGLPPLEVGR